MLLHPQNHEMEIYHFITLQDAVLLVLRGTTFMLMYDIYFLMIYDNYIDEKLRCY